MKLALVQSEIFIGEKTGGVNITNLTKWLEQHKEPVWRSMMKWNVKDLLDHHEWDEYFKPKINRIMDKILKEKDIDPLIVLEDPKDKSVFVIDGWHRLYVMYNISLHIPKQEYVSFKTHIVTHKICKKFPILEKGVVGVTML